MSAAVHTLNLSEISNLSIGQCFNNARLSMPATFYLEKGELDNNVLVTNAKLTNQITQFATESEQALTTPSSSIELVVFSDLPIGSLVNLVNQCQLELLALNQINSRVSLTSYRFAISCENLTHARALLVDFNSAHGIESAIIDGAPVLAEPGLLVMDMDSTAIEIECIDEIAKLAGTGEQVAAVTELAMQGKLDFSQSLHQRVATLTNSSEAILQQVISTLPLMPGLELLVTELKKHNWRVAIASGGFTYFADYLKETLGLDAAFANQLDIVDGKLTGKVLGDVVDAQAKADCLQRLALQYDIPTSQTVAMGDGANDLVMMSVAGLGAAFHAKPIVKQKANTSVSNADLSCLLHWLK